MSSDILELNRALREGRSVEQREVDPREVRGAQLQNTGVGMLVENRFVGEEEKGPKPL
jgi:hypothetical protein